MDYEADFRRRLAHIEEGIIALIPAESTPPDRLHTAMRYAMQAGGKRLRPMLVLAAADLAASAGQGGDALPAAVAVECVHTYSLIHDDLPCMDNDDLRRGRPTVHRAFDEATALLAGDALLTHAFLLLGEGYRSEPGLARALVAELAEAAGSRRLIGGQMADLLAEKNARATADDVEFIHRNKTGAMIEASMAMGALCGRADESALAALRRAGRRLGLAFQIVDDILDVTADSATLGKTAGKDAKADKATFVKIHGLEASRRRAREETQAAVEALREVRGESAFLVRLAGSMVERVR